MISPFTSKHCLVAIDNLRQLDLPNLQENPVILRSILPMIAVNSYSQGSTHGKLFYGPETIANKNLTMENFRINCPISRFLFAAAYKTFCLRLDVAKHWKNGRTWNCQVQVALFPPAFYYEISGSVVTHHGAREGQETKQFPNLLLRIQIFVVEREHCGTNHVSAELIHKALNPNSHDMLWKSEDYSRDTFICFGATKSVDKVDTQTSMVHATSTHITNMKLLSLHQKSKKRFSTLDKNNLADFKNNIKELYLHRSRM